MEIHKEVVETMIETAGEAGVEFCLNAAPATPIVEWMYRYITHLLVNESEAAIMSGRDREKEKDAFQSSIMRGPGNIIIIRHRNHTRSISFTHHSRSHRVNWFIIHQ